MLDSRKSGKEFWEEREENSKLEIRNSKQIEMNSKQKIPNKLDAGSRFGNFSDFGFIGFAVSLEFRASDLSFKFRRVAGLFRISCFEFRNCQSV